MLSQSSYDPHILKSNGRAEPALFLPAPGIAGSTEKDRRADTHSAEMVPLLYMGMGEVALEDIVRGKLLCNMSERLVPVALTEQISYDPDLHPRRWIGPP